MLFNGARQILSPVPATKQSILEAAFFRKYLLRIIAGHLEVKGERSAK